MGLGTVRGVAAPSPRGTRFRGLRIAVGWCIVLHEALRIPCRRHNGTPDDYGGRGGADGHEPPTFGVNFVSEKD